jgi:phospholipid/cholesterol/gamma-HCH transport system substrate-binding protein
VLVNKIQGPTTDFATNGLPQMTAAMIDLQNAAQALTRLMNEVQTSPSSVLGKPAGQEIKVKP